MMIDRFSGEYAFLSNFYPCMVNLEFLDGDYMRYPSVEHAYQAAKTNDLQIRLEFTNPNLKPGQAKRLGRTFPVTTSDWNNVKLFVMRNLIWQKFDQDDLRDKLIETYPKQLIEGNWWGDKFWGVHEGIGLNHLGHILMDKRQSIISNQFYQ